MSEDEPRQPVPELRPIRDVNLEVAAAGIDQVVAHVRRTIRPRAAGRRLPGALDRAKRHTQLRVATRRCQFLDRLALTIAAEKSMRPYAPAGSQWRICSTRLTDSTYCRQSIAEQRRRLVIALATET